MKITSKDIQNFVRLTKAARYSYDNKQIYRRLGRKILKELANELGLPTASYQIRFNAGGIACSGDHILHSETVYLALHDNIGFGSFYYRKCKGRNDYSGAGGPNINVSWKTLQDIGIKGLAEMIRRDCFPEKMIDQRNLF